MRGFNILLRDFSLFSHSQCWSPSLWIYYHIHHHLLNVQGGPCPARDSIYSSQQTERQRLLINIFLMRRSSERLNGLFCAKSQLVSQGVECSSVPRSSKPGPYPSFMNAYFATFAFSVSKICTVQDCNHQPPVVSITYFKCGQSKMRQCISQTQ